MAIPRQDKNTDPLPIAEDGDLAWTGMDMRAPPLVQPGFASSAKNMRVEDGVYWPRKGLFTPTWTRYASGDFPYRSSYLRNDDAAWTAAYATTYGSCIFSDPNSSGDTWLVRVCGSALLFFRETEIGRIIDFGPGLTVSGPVIIFQNFNTLVINRGGTESSLVWSGSFDALVTELVPSSIASGYAAVPPASYGLAWRERSVLLCDRDNLVLSRIADSTQYDTTDGIFYVNKGAGDTLRAAVPIGARSLLVLKSQSLHVFSATLGDLTDARLDVQAVEIRFDSPKTAVSADNKVWWLDRRGVRTAEVAQIEGDNKIRLQIDSTISDKIRPLVNRINWQYASLFSAAVTTDRIYFAVALDTQTTPQTLLVWNRVFNEWESYDQWNSTLGFSVQSLIAGYEWLKEPRLFAISSTGYAACLNYGLGEDHVGWSGDVATTYAVIQEFTSRGYTAGTNDTKLFKLAKIQADTWNPGTLYVRAVYDGPEESGSVGSLARNRIKYFTGKADFTPSNVNGDFHVARRQDYSVRISGDSSNGYTKWTVGNTYATGDYVYFPDNGHNYRALQGSTAERTTVPGEDPRYWWKTTDGITSTTPTWTAGNTYYEGQRVAYHYNYHALVGQVASYGNDPSRHPEYWEDLGLDTGTIYLGSPEVVAPMSSYHSADVNRDSVISFREYERVLDLYNYRSGTTRTGEYHTDALGYSGFSPGPGSITTYHSADTDQNGRISLLELTRVIELLNSSGGAYHVEAGTEDGFASGADPVVITPAGGDGIRFEDFQQTIDRRPINQEAVWCQLFISNTQGAFKIRSLAIEAQPGNRVNSTY